MKEIKVTVNTWYVVEGAAGATVINPLTNRAIATVEDGKQASFLATTPYVVASDDSVSVFKAPFNSAPAKLKLLGLLGGGSSTGLPAGYFNALFLESTGTQYMNTGFKLDEPFVIDVDYSTTEIVSYGAVFGARLSDGRIDIMRYGTSNASYCYYSQNTASVIFTDLVGQRNKIRYDVPNSQIATNGQVNNITGWASSVKILDMYLFAENFPQGGIATNPPRVVYKNKIKMYRFYFEKDKTYDFIPAITRDGVPCLIDTVNKKELRNAETGDFVVGFTLEQARKLSKLSSTGGTLAISLPANYTEDAEVVAALASAEAKGWVFEKRTYDADGTTSTFALRRILVRKTHDDNGNYVDENGTRYRVEWCEEVLGAEPETLGYEPFRNVEAACDYWGLAPYVDPEWEEELLTETN